MEFSNTTTKDGIIQDCEFWLFASNYGQISNDTNLMRTFTSLANRALDSVVTKILSADDRWQFDDTNYTDYPVATTDVVLGQRDYVLSVSHLKITRVEIKDAQGSWSKLTAIDLIDIPVARDEYFKSNGAPLFYDKSGNSLFLYPSADYNVTAGLRVYYQREPSYYVFTDTTKKAGFENILHRLISIKACYDYAVANNLTDKIMVLSAEITKKETELNQFYGRRNKDERPQLTAMETPSF